MKRTHYIQGMRDGQRRHDHDQAQFPHDGARFHHDDPRGESQGRGRGRGFGGRGFGVPGFGPGGPGFNGFGPDFARAFAGGGRGRAGRGDVRSAILSLLSESSSNGYGLIKAITEKTNGAWRPSPGSVYPTLQQLVDEELITSTGDGRRTEYELTDAGKAYVAEHADELNAAWEATGGQSESVAAFHGSVAKLMGVVQQVRFAATDEQRNAAAEKLDEARRALYLILAD